MGVASITIGLTAAVGCDRNGNNGPNGTGTGAVVTPAPPGGVNATSGAIRGSSGDNAMDATGGGNGSAAITPGGAGANSATSTDRSTGASGGGAGGHVPGSGVATDATNASPPGGAGTAKPENTPR